MRISDWSSDVCSSDLAAGPFDRRQRHLRRDAATAPGTAAGAGVHRVPRGEVRRKPALGARSGKIAGFPSSAAVRRPRSCFMSHVDIRSAARPDPDQPMVDIADYVIDAKIDSPAAYARSEEHTSELPSLMRIS